MTSHEYFSSSNLIKEFGYQLATNDLEEGTNDLEKFSKFLRSLTQEDYNDLYQKAGEIAFEMFEANPQLYETLAFLGEDKQKIALEELFQKVTEKTLNEMIIEKFQQSS
jgi:hypothetical protein